MKNIFQKNNHFPPSLKNKIKSQHVSKVAMVSFATFVAIKIAL